MGEIARVIDGVVKDALGDVMKQAGFRKAGRNFRRATGDALQVLNVQASVWNESSSGRFTVNLGTYYPAIGEILEKPLGKEWPAEYDCHVHQRLGNLMPCACDWWWEVDSLSDRGDVAAQLCDAVTSYGLPWLDRVSTLDGGGAESRPHEVHTRLAIALLQGRREDAKTLFRSHYDEKPQLSQTWIDWAKRHDLIEA